MTAGSAGSGRHSWPAQGPSLSGRQHEILALLSQGKSNKEIGLALGLTTGTVKQHVYALFRKLGVRNRTMAAIRATQVATAAPAPDPKPTGALQPAASQLPASTLDDRQYTRRLVTAVAIELHGRDKNPAADDAAGTDATIAQLRGEAERIAYNFDARFEPLPGGGAAAWFGQPVAHGDDAARALAFVRALAAGAGDGVGHRCSIGIGTVPEVVGQGERASLAFRAFRVAMLLATFGEPGLPLACALSADLAEEHADPGAKDVAGLCDLPVAARLIGPQFTLSPSALRHWGGLPFVSELEAAARRGRCSWIAIESWPPEDGTRLIQAIGASLSARAVPAYRLWMPASLSGGDVAKRLGGQLRDEFRRHGRPGSFGDLDDGILRLGANGPAVLLACGIDAFEMLVTLLRAETLEKLRSMPIIVVAGAMRRAGAPQTAIRLLGPHPMGSPFVRVLRLAVPAAAARPPHGIRAGVQAVLDGVSPFARKVARKVAELRPNELGPLAAALGVSRETAAAGCRELQDAGLLVRGDETLQFRDAATADAIRASMVAQVK